MTRATPVTGTATATATDPSVAERAPVATVNVVVTGAFSVGGARARGDYIAPSSFIRRMAS